MNVPIKKMTIKKYLDGHKTYEIGTLFDVKFEDKDYLLPVPQSEIEKAPRQRLFVTCASERNREGSCIRSEPWV